MYIIIAQTSEIDFATFSSTYLVCKRGVRVGHAIGYNLTRPDPTVRNVWIKPTDVQFLGDKQRRLYYFDSR